MKVTLLGCGTSVGVPAIGRAGWGACDPNDSRNRRQRCAVLVQSETTNVLVDAGPDIRNQLLPLGLQKIERCRHVKPGSCSGRFTKFGLCEQS